MSEEIPDWLLKGTFCIEYNPNCPGKFLVRLPGKSGRIDKRQYIWENDPTLTGDILGFGPTLKDAAEAARLLKFPT